jgi:putative acetyltransferase
MITIRPEAHSDHASIRRVVEAAFPTRLEADLVDLLRDRGKLLVSLVATFDGGVAGHVAFSPVCVERAGTIVARGAGLAPLAVAPEFERRGIGSALCIRGVEACAGLDMPFVVVLGEPAYYSRFAFRPASSFTLDNEYGAGDAFLALPLRADGIPHGGGLVRYSSEFAELAL